MDYQKAASFWEEKGKNSVRMEPAKLQKQIETFIQKQNTCALATADLEGFVRCTPLEYTYKDNCFWILSEGGLKFRGLEKNKNVSLAIYENYNSFGNLNGLQIMGWAEIIKPWSQNYLMILDYKHISHDALRKMPSEMNLIQIHPTSYDFLSSDLKKEGYDSRQHLDL